MSTAVEKQDTQIENGPEWLDSIGAYYSEAPWYGKLGIGIALLIVIAILIIITVSIAYNLWYLIYKI